MELDPDLVRRALAGDRNAFHQVVETLWGLVYVFVRQRVRDNEHARDLTQEAFLSAFEKRSALREPQNFVTWLLAIAAHRVIDHRRRKTVRAEQELPPHDAPATAARDDAATQLEREEERLLVERCVADLDDHYRAVLILRYWSGMTPAQIARLLAEPEGTIRNRIFRAHIRLRRLLSRTGMEGEEEEDGVVGVDPTAPEPRGSTLDTMTPTLRGRRK